MDSEIFINEWEQSSLQPMTTAGISFKYFTPHQFLVLQNPQQLNRVATILVY
jgi:hypothetical protein